MQGKSYGNGVKATMAGLSNWKLLAEALHIDDLGMMVVCWRTTAIQGSNPGDQAALSRDAMPAPIRGRP